MKANEFVKKFGWDRAKREVELIGTIAAMCCEDDFNNDLKRLVESYDLVESWGGLEDAKLYSFDHCKDKPESAGYKLMMAIKDVESCK